MKKAIIPVIMLVLMVQLAFAIGIEPTISISANPSDVTTYSNIVVSAVDALDRAGLEYIKLYRDGELYKEKDCKSGSICTLIITEYSRGSTHTYYAQTKDLDGNVKTTSTVTVVFTGNNAPILDPIVSITAREGELVDIASYIHVYDADNDSITIDVYTPFDVEDVPLGDPVTWQTDYDDAGNYNVYVRVYDPSGDFDEEMFSLVILDTPTINVTLETPEDGFITNVQDVNVICDVYSIVPLQTVTLYTDISGTWQAYTGAPTSINPWSYIIDDVPEGTYEWNCEAANEYDTISAADNYAFTVDITPPEVNYNNIGTVTYDPAGYTFTANVTDNVEIDTVVLEVDGVAYSHSIGDDQATITEQITANAGNHIYRWIALDTATNMYDSGIINFTVDKAASVIELTLNGEANNITADDGEEIHAFGEVIAGEGDVSLYVDGVFEGSGNPDIAVIETYALPGLHNFTLVYTETENYTSSNITRFAEVVWSPFVISNIHVEDITKYTATLSWNTNRAANSSFACGADPANMSITGANSTLVPGHHVFSLTGLSQNTTYYCIVQSTDNYSNFAESDIFEFTTLPLTGCTIPRDDMVITKNTILCEGTYNVNDVDGNGAAIWIQGNNIDVSCNGTILIGDGDGIGFVVAGNGIYEEDVSISGCTIENYDYGMSLSKAIGLTINNNNFNNVGVGILVDIVQDSTFSNDNFNIFDIAIYSPEGSYGNYNNRIENINASNGEEGIGLNDWRNTLLNNITIQNTDDAGIAFMGGSSNNLITSSNMDSPLIAFNNSVGNIARDSTILDPTIEDIYVDDNSQLTLINVIFGGSTETQVDASSELIVQWELDVFVTDAISDIENALVTIYNGLGTEVFSGLTDSDGAIPQMTVTEFVESGSVLSHNPYTFNVTADDYNPASVSYNITSNTGVSILITPYIMPTTGNIIINEIMPGNDWVEIYNNDTVEINIAGWTLENSTGTIATLAGTLSPGEYLAIYVSNSLDDSGDVVSLLDSTATIVDSRIYGALTPGMSFGRYLDATNNWIALTNPTPGSANIGPNTAPVFTSAALNAAIQERHLFSYDVNATDADNDTLTFSDDAAQFDINAVTGEISFTPLIVELINATITVCDNSGAVNDCISQAFILNVTPNNAPVFTSAEVNTNVQINTLFTYDVNATDADNDTLTYSTNSAFFDIDPVTGVISFTPTSAGVINATITVCDGTGTATECTVQPFILDVLSNAAPVFTSAAVNRGIVVNTSFDYDINATDADNDTLTFSDDAAQFDIDPVTGVISFTPSVIELINATITVCDDSGFPNNCTTQEFLLDVTPVPVYTFNMTDPADQNIYNTTNAIYAITLTNTGNVADSYNLTLTNVNSASTAALNLYTITDIAAGSSEAITLTVGDSTPGNYTVTIDAVSLNNPASTAQINVTTNIREVEVYGVDISNPTGITIDTISNAVYTLTITNTGNQIDGFDLTINNIDNVSTATLNQTSVDNLAPGASGTVTLTIHDDKTGYFDLSVVVVSQTLVSAQDATAVFTTRINQAKGNLSGQVIDANNSIYHATVDLYRGMSLIASTTTDANGNYAFTNINAWDYNISITKPGFNNDVQAVTVVYSTPDHDVTLTPASFAGALQGDMIDGVDGTTRIANATITIRKSDTSEIVQIVKSDSSGVYTINGLVPTVGFTYNLDATAAGYTEAFAPKGVALTLGETKTGQDIYMI